MSEDLPDAPEQPINPFARFIDMQPVKGVPTLHTVNGIGFTLVGARDHDEETGTYVKTHSFCVLFIPLLAIGAYRVWDAPEGGWYFLGKVPLSRFARNWNWLVLLIAVGLGGFGWWSHHTGTPEYRAAQELAQADALVAAGKHGEATGIYERLIMVPSPSSSAALERITGLVNAPPSDPLEASAVYRAGLSLQRQNRLPATDLYPRALKQVEASEQASPRAALVLYEAVESLAPKAEDRLAVRRRLLERITKTDPADTEVAVKLATVYEALGEGAKSETLLEPHKDKLGSGEGAAILGRIYARQGKLEAARELLDAYVNANLPRVQGLESKLKPIYDRIQRDLFNDMAAGRIPGVTINDFQNAPEERKKEIFLKAYLPRLKTDAELKAVEQDREAVQGVIAAVLELGMVHLSRAQQLADLEKRTQALLAAEKAFVSIQAQAGESDDYKLHLGQVYYWLGRADEGKKLFDELLDKHQRSADMVGRVANALREVGSVSQARKTVEDAYEKEVEPGKKHNLALTRSTMHTDLDDQIAWLKKGNPTDDEVLASLAHSQGQKAAQDGNDTEAAKFYTEALEHYKKMPESTASLNNSALVYFSRFYITQDREDMRTGTDRLDRAMALRAGDSILLSNAAGMLLESLSFDLMDGSVDWKALKRGGGLDLLGYLYKDHAGKRRVAERMRRHPSFIKAVAYYEKLLLLSPKRPSAYFALYWLHSFVEDTASLQALANRLEKTALDQETEQREMRDLLEGKKDAKQLSDNDKALKRAEEVLAKARTVGGRTLAVAAGRVMSLRMPRFTYGKSVDADAIVKLAEEAEKAETSSSTRGELFDALMFRAHLRLMKAELAYKAQADRTRRSLGHHLLPWFVWKEGPLREKALADADVKRAVAIKAEQGRAFADNPRATTWAVLAGPEPELASKLAKVLATDAHEEASRRIDRVLSPFSAAVAMDGAWSLIVRGKQAEAEQLLAAVAARGIPMPADEK